jgi:putative endonuclease
MPASDRGAVGRIGEDAAAGAYVARGFRILARNWRCPLGEIDLVAQRGTLVVVCEVKTRRRSVFGGPFDAGTAAKRRRLRALAAAFLSLGFDRAEGSAPACEADVRFDVASVSIDASGRPAVHLFEDAF